MKFLISICLLVSISFAIKPSALQYIDIKVQHKYSNGKNKDYIIQREIHSDCIYIAIESESFSNIKDIDNKCKKSIISTVGVIQPQQIKEGIKTFSELEVLDFIYNYSIKEPKKYILVDARKQSFFDYKTIPSSANIPYEDLKYDEDFEEDFYNTYKKLGVKVLNKNSFDFTNAKTALFFCNGPWCPVSSRTIKYLEKLGYPKEKLLWYRGGITGWETLNLTLTKTLEE